MAPRDQQTGTADRGARPVPPLRVADSRRYLADHRDRPVWVQGDTAWSLIAQLRWADAVTYLDDRAARGFNSLIVSLIERKFASRAPATIDGLEPFVAPGDIARPSPDYLDHARRYLAAAGERGLTVWLCPAYLGWGGGDEGFFGEIRAAGPDALRRYGRAVGEQLGDLTNVVWMMGGDYALPAELRWTGDALAAGLRDAGATGLMTAHGGQTTAGETFGDPRWLDCDTVYRYQGDLWRPLLAQYRRRPTRPFVMIESTYENEHESRPEQIRRQACWPLVCGACGQFFGNNPIWHFDGPGLIPALAPWTQQLDSVGARDMARLARMVATLPWWRLVPDLDRPLIVDGAGDVTARVAAARSPGDDLAVAYVPSTGTEPRELTVDTAALPAAAVVRWRNPARDDADPPAERLAGGGSVPLRTPGDNGTGTNDWWLVIGPG